jgi:hypothetical protein
MHISGSNTKIPEFIPVVKAEPMPGTQFIIRKSLKMNESPSQKQPYTKNEQKDLVLSENLSQFSREVPDVFAHKAP